MADDTIPAGKLPVDLLRRLLHGATRSDDVLVGPAIGEDACALAVPAGVLVVATDPVTFTNSHLGRLAVIVNANDIAVMGVRPRWFLATILLPVGTTEEELVELFDDMGRALADVGATLVGGHTEVTTAVKRPVVVGHMLGMADDGRCTPTGAARPDDVILQIGMVPVEGAAVLAVEAAARLGRLEPTTLRAAATGFVDPGISVVAAALLAAQLGATAMHDLTEGGLAAGLHELASAAGVALRIERGNVAWFEPGLDVCRALGADPWATLASGSLLAAFRPADAPAARQALAAAGHTVAAIGVAQPGGGVSDTDDQPLGCPDRDEVARLLEG